jgi:hypothetical protein
MKTILLSLSLSALVLVSGMNTAQANEHSLPQNICSALLSPNNLAFAKTASLFLGGYVAFLFGFNSAVTAKLAKDDYTVTGKQEYLEEARTHSKKACITLPISIALFIAGAYYTTRVVS